MKNKFLGLAATTILSVQCVWAGDEDPFRTPPSSPVHAPQAFVCPDAPLRQAQGSPDDNNMADRFFFAHGNLVAHAGMPPQPNIVGQPGDLFTPIHAARADDGQLPPIDDDRADDGQLPPVPTNRTLGFGAELVFPTFPLDFLENIDWVLRTLPPAMPLPPIAVDELPGDEAPQDDAYSEGQIEYNQADREALALSEAYEIHNYSKLIITDIMTHIEAQNRGRQLATLNDAYNALESWVNNNYRDDGYYEAMDAVQAGWTLTTRHMLPMVYTFMLNNHSDKIGIWFSGFVTESMTAYINARDSLSCVQGIEERIITGLRGIDAELNLIFAGPERTLLLNNFLKNTLNINSPTKLKNIASNICKIGVNENTTPNRAMVKFQEYINAEVSQHGDLTPNKIANINAVCAIFNDEYDEIVKPVVITLLGEQAVERALLAAEALSLGNMTLADSENISPNSPVSETGNKRQYTDSNEGPNKRRQL
jgi:hypothetical protein